MNEEITGIKRFTTKKIKYFHNANDMLLWFINTGGILWPLDGEN